MRHFRRNLETLNLDLGQSASQIIPIIIGSSGEQLIMMALAALKRGLFLQPIDFPAVQAHARRFRIAVSAQLTREDIDEACNIIEDVIARPLGARIREQPDLIALGASSRKISSAPAAHGGPRRTTTKARSR